MVVAGSFDVHGERHFSTHKSPISGHESLFFGHESLFFGHESLFFGHESLFFGHESPISGHESRLFDPRKSDFRHCERSVATVSRRRKQTVLVDFQGATLFQYDFFLTFCLVPKTHVFGWSVGLARHVERSETSPPLCGGNLHLRSG